MFHHDTLTGQVALVTGAGSGIGEAAARFLAEAGAAIALVDLDAESIDRVRDELVAQKVRAISISANIGEPFSIEEACQKCGEHFGRIDVVVANAGINGFWGPLEQTSVEEWDRVMETNLRGTFLTVKNCLRFLKERGGSVIITSSVNGTRMFSNTGATAYATSKAGQVAFAKMIALELAKHRIRVNVICPGSVRTNIGESTKQSALEEIREPVQFPAGVVPLKRGEPADPYEVAKLIWFLASPGSSHISGAEIFIDGTQSLFQG
jgi:NAD(P)-dependent dehydrogenase (short-subunit alcohol dehydrogenase family)